MGELEAIHDPGALGALAGPGTAQNKDNLWLLYAHDSDIVWWGCGGGGDEPIAGLGMSQLVLRQR